MSERPLWFGERDEPLFGWFGSPDGGQAVGGIALCPPVGAEYRSVHRVYRHLAGQLRAAGFATLRFDYSGTADSAGDLDAPGRVARWVDDIADAVEVLRRAGAGHAGAVAMRLGATLVCQAVTTGRTRLDSLVLWDPCANGRSFLREQQLVMAATSGIQAPDSGDDDGVETSGYRFGADVSEQIRGLDLATLPEVARLAGRTVVFSRAERPARRLLAVLDRLGVERDVAEGQQELLEVWPEDAVVPERTAGRIVEWLRAAAPEQPGTIAAPPAPERIQVVGTTVHERAVRLGPNDLFGIVTEPEEPDERAPWIVLPNAGAETRIGPGRLWVDLARRWAAEGLRCLRVDLRGLGDSPCGPGQQEYQTYVPQWLDDLPDAVAAIAPRDPDNVVLVGLCSGAYSSLETALAGHPRGVCAINPILEQGFANLPENRADPRRRAIRPVPARLVRLAVRHKRTSEALWRAIRQVAVWRSPMSVPAAVVGRGTDLLLVLSAHDAVPFRDTEYWTRLGEPRLARTGRFQVRVLPDLDHSLYLSSSRATVARLLTDHILSRYAPTR